MLAVFIDPSIELASRILGTLVFATALTGKVRHNVVFGEVVVEEGMATR